MKRSENDAAGSDRERQACIEHVKAIAEKMDEIAFTGISPEEKMLLRRILFQICENVEKERNR